MGTSSNLIKRLIEAGEYTSERCWELPLWEEYDEDIKDETADLKKYRKWRRRNYNWRKIFS
jgi:leucyl aminopeptidase